MLQCLDPFSVLCARQILFWIHGLVVDAHFVMEVWPSRTTGRAHQPDSLPAHHRVANANFDVALWNPLGDYLRDRGVRVHLGTRVSRVIPGSPLLL